MRLLSSRRGGLKATALLGLCVIVIPARLVRAETGTVAATAVACRAAATALPPPSDRPDEVQRRALAGCDAEALYYGIGRPADPAAARLCAFSQQAHPGAEDRPGFSGDEMLMSIYANGVGAKRDLTYATRLACTIASAPAEVDARVADLQGKLRSNWEGHDFSWCDDITSGYAGGACAAHDQRIADQARHAALDRIAARLSGAAKARFTELRMAQAAWSQARGDQETDLSGTARAQFVIDEEQRQDKDFLDMLKRLETGSPPRLGAVQLQAADARMNKVYNQVQSLADDPLQGGTVKKADVRLVQRVWLRYRDAWGAFAGAAYPDLGAQGAMAWVTMKRADMLTSFLDP